MATDRAKAADEKFCRSCGEPIKKEAEICPHCGVRNEGAPRTVRRSTATPAGATAVHDPSEYETTVSENWWYAVAFGVATWVLYILIASVVSDGLLFGLGAFLALVGWIAMPVAIYFDAKYVRANARWNPNTALYVVGAIVLLANVVTGLVYLYRRHETLGEP